MAEQDLTRPAFRYSSAGRRPERLNQSRDVNAPLQLARGWAAGLLGLPGDIEGLVRMLPGIHNETPVLPTSDFYREALPGYDERPAARAISGLGALTGGAGATGVVRGGLGAVKRATDLNAIRDYVRATQGMAGLPGAAVVKPKGGNWLANAGSPEEAVRPLRTTIVGMEPAERIPVVEDVIRQYEAAGEGATPFVERMRADKQRLAREGALNTWIDQKLTKYIRNEMGTPEDPLRALIQERGVSHLPLEQLQEGAEWLPDSVVLARRAAGFPEEGMALERHAAAGYPMGLPEEYTRAAQGWEVAADTPITPYRAGRIIDRGPGSADIAEMYLRENPWLAKVPPETPVYSLDPRRGFRDMDLGFSHLVDELRNAVTPNSGLPRELQLKPEQLSKVTMPQAVELVDRINKWRAAQKAEADLARSTNIATFEHKAYPEQGYRWVELRLPEESNPLPEGYSLSTVTNERLPPGHMGRNSYAVVDPQGRMLEGTGTAYTEADAMDKFKRAYYGKALEDALKYEGEVMGHCVGGYCPDVIEGRTRIFSLRDAKGQPHVTVEVRPGRQLNEKDVPNDVRDMLAEQYGDASREEFEAAVQAYLRQRSVPDEIVQIKGKQNRAPKADYLPYVQDFVRSGQWGRVGDLGNTGLIRLERPYTARIPAGNELRELNVSPGYYTSAELERQLIEQGASPEMAKVFAEGQGGARYARGGLVSSYDPARIDALAQQILASAA